MGHLVHIQALRLPSFTSFYDSHWTMPWALFDILCLHVKWGLCFILSVITINGNTRLVFSVIIWLLLQNSCCVFSITSSLVVTCNLIWFLKIWGLVNMPDCQLWKELGISNNSHNITRCFGDVMSPLSNYVNYCKFLSSQKCHVLIWLLEISNNCHKISVSKSTQLCFLYTLQRSSLLSSNPFFWRSIQLL